MTKQTLNPSATVRVNAPCVCVSADLPLKSALSSASGLLLSESDAFAVCPLYIFTRTCFNVKNQSDRRGSDGWSTKEKRIPKNLQLEVAAKSDFYSKYNPVRSVRTQVFQTKATFFDYFFIRVRRDGCFVAPTAAGARRGTARARRGDRSERVN